MKKAAIVFVLILVMITLGFSQTYKGKGRITGLILDEAGNPIEGVKIKLFSLRGKSGFEVETDAEGKWIASWLRGGSWDIDFEKVGYMRKSISIHVTEYGKKPPPIEIRLTAVEGFLITDELKAALKEGNELFADEKYLEAIVVYKKLIEDFPEAYTINNNIGNAHFLMEDYDEAEKYYLKVLEQDPENNDSKLFIGNCCTNRGQDDKALEWYNKIEFEKINDATVLYNIGTKYYSLAKFQEALKYYKRSVEIKNDFLDGIYQLGLVHLSLGNYNDSIDVFTEYKKYDTESDRSAQVDSFIEFLKTKIDR